MPTCNRFAETSSLSDHGKVRLATPLSWDQCEFKAVAADWAAVIGLC